MAASNTGGPSNRAFRLCIVSLIVLFGIIVWQRDRVRAYWQARRLIATSDLGARGNHLAGLITLGPKAIGAIRMLAHDESPDVRSLAVYALQSLKGGEGISDLKGLAADADQSVREAAVTGLALMQRPEATTALCELADSSNDDVACAAAANLNRLNASRAHQLLCRLAQSHSSPLVRAQAIESLIDLQSESQASSRDCDLCLILADALADRATFSGALALERQRTAAEEFAAHLSERRPTTLPSNITPPSAETFFRSVAAPPSKPRTVAQYAASCLSILTGQSLNWEALPRDAVVEKCRQRATTQADGRP